MALTQNFKREGTSEDGRDPREKFQLCTSRESCQDCLMLVGRGTMSWRFRIDFNREMNSFGFTRLQEILGRGRGVVWGLFSFIFVYSPNNFRQSCERKCKWGGFSIGFGFWTQLWPLPYERKIFARSTKTWNGTTTLLHLRVQVLHREIIVTKQHLGIMINKTVREQK